MRRPHRRAIKGSGTAPRRLLERAEARKIGGPRCAAWCEPSMQLSREALRASGWARSLRLASS